MTSMFILPTADRTLGACETAGQVFYKQMASAASPGLAVVAVPGEATGRKHPRLATNENGETLLVWTDGMAWARGGSVAWLLFDRQGRRSGQMSDRLACRCGASPLLLRIRTEVSASSINRANDIDIQIFPTDTNRTVSYATHHTQRTRCRTRPTRSKSAKRESCLGHSRYAPRAAPRCDTRELILSSRPSTTSRPSGPGSEQRCRDSSRGQRRLFPAHPS